MREIYPCHIDSDDHLAVASDGSRYLGFNTHPDRASVFLTPEDVARLRDTLNEWLGEKPRVLDEDAVRRIVQDQLDRILSGPVVPIAPAGPAPNLLAQSAAAQTTETPEDIWGAPCTRCTHSTGMHFYPGGCAYPGGCECTWADVSAPAPECTCGHRKSDHGCEETGWKGCLKAACGCALYLGAPGPASAR